MLVAAVAQLHLELLVLEVLVVVVQEAFHQQELLELQI
jgi:hypothetical protein